MAKKPAKAPKGGGVVPMGNAGVQTQGITDMNAGKKMKTTYTAAPQRFRPGGAGAKGVGVPGPFGKAPPAMPPMKKGGKC